MKFKTIKDLNGKMWYRLLKVIYILIFVVIIGLFIGDAISAYGGVSDEQVYNQLILDNPKFKEVMKEVDLCKVIRMCRIGEVEECELINEARKKVIRKQKIEDAFWYLVIISFMVLIFEIARRVFYYIVIGKIKPKKINN